MVVLLLTIVLSPWFAKIEIGSTYAGILPPESDPQRVYLNKINAEFGGDNTAILVITHHQIFNHDTLSKIRRLTKAIEELPAVEYVQSLTNASIIKSEHDEIFLDNISDDIPSSPRELEQFRQDILSNPLYINNLISPDERTTCITATIDRTAPDKVARITIDEINRLAEEEAGPEEIYVDGLAAMATSIFHMVSQDLITYLPITCFIIVIILYLTFRNIRVVILSSIVIAMAIVCVFAFMAVEHVPLFTFTATLPPIMAALGISYSIHVFMEFFRRRSTTSSSRKATWRALRSVLLAVWLSAVTTAIGFASLILLNIVAIRRMGVFLVLGVLLLLVLLTFFVPPLLVFFFSRGHIKRSFTSPLVRKIFERFLKLALLYRIPILALTAVTIVLSIVGFAKLSVKTDVLHEYFRESAPLRIAINVLTERLHGSTPLNVIVEGPSEGAIEDPAFLRSVQRLQSILDKQPSVGKTISVVDYIKNVNKAMHDNDPTYYRLPKTKEEISQYLLVYSLADKQRTMDRYVDYENRIARVTVRSSITSSDKLLEFKSFIEDRCREVFPQNVKARVTGDIVLTAIVAQNISWGILYSFGLAALTISIIMVILFRSIKMGLIAMIPNLLPLLIILGLMGWANIHFNLGTCLVICVAIGIAVDDTIHFLVRYFYELRQTNHYLVRAITGVRITAGQRQAISATMDRVGRPIVLTSVAIFSGFLVLAFSQFVPIAYFGVLTAITMVLCLICDLVILPILLSIISI